MNDNSTATSENTKLCPYCAETIKAAAIVCRYCGRDLTPAAPAVDPPVQHFNLAPPPAQTGPYKPGPRYAEAKPTVGQRKGLPTWLSVLIALGMLLGGVVVCSSFATRNGSMPAGSGAAVARPTLTAGQLKRDATRIAYDDLARNTEQYIGDLMVADGTVIQVLEDGAAAQLRLSMADDPGKVLFVFYPGFSRQRVLNGDRVTVYGPVYGRLSYEAVLGQKITIPAMTANLLEVQP